MRNRYAIMKKLKTKIGVLVSYYCRENTYHETQLTNRATRFASISEAQKVADRLSFGSIGEYSVVEVPAR